jgi:hypothetical protein
MVKAHKREVILLLDFLEHSYDNRTMESSKKNPLSNHLFLIISLFFLTMIIGLTVVQSQKQQTTNTAAQTNTVISPISNPPSPTESKINIVSEERRVQYKECLKNIRCSVEEKDLNQDGEANVLDYHVYLLN